MRYRDRSTPRRLGDVRDLMLTPPAWRRDELTPAEEAEHERQQERDGGGPVCGHDGTASGVLDGVRNGRLIPAIHCAACGAVLQTLDAIHHNVTPALGDMREAA